MVGEVTNKESAHHLIEEIKRRQGSINLLVCNAGIMGPDANTLYQIQQSCIDQIHYLMHSTSSMADFSHVLDTNVSSCPSYHLSLVKGYWTWILDELLA